jgi:hypothetical protein
MCSVRGKIEGNGSEVVKVKIQFRVSYVNGEVVLESGKTFCFPGDETKSHRGCVFDLSVY